MSIIGTRPPLISETNFYELHTIAFKIIVNTGNMSYTT